MFVLNMHWRTGAILQQQTFLAKPNGNNTGQWFRWIGWGSKRDKLAGFGSDEVNQIEATEDALYDSSNYWRRFNAPRPSADVTKEPVYAVFVVVAVPMFWPWPA